MDLASVIRGKDCTHYSRCQRIALVNIRNIRVKFLPDVISVKLPFKQMYAVLLVMSYPPVFQ